MRRRLGLLFTIVLFTTVAFGQYGYVTGKISDRFGAISNVAVSMKGSPFGTYTDEEGYFAFEIDTGVYQLNVDLTGYQPYNLTIQLGDLEQREINIELENTLMDGSVGVGTKSNESENQLDSPVPVDLILANDLVSTGEIELGPALHQLLPNFYSAKQSADDAVNVIDPVSLRGLGPDQLLVLVNGKRRHKSAFLNVSDVFGKGTAGHDINSIPIAAIDKIEILRDGASSQYGSDAIGGVMNIVLKSRAVNTTVDTQVGGTSNGDGFTRGLTFNTGYGFKQRGYVNVTGSFMIQDAVNRGGEYTNIIYGVDSLETPERRQEFFDQTGFPNNTIAEIGSSSFQTGGIVFNGNFEINDDFDVYGFGGFNTKIGNVNTIYRLPFSERQIGDYFWYPNGFSPLLVPESEDRSLVIGTRGSAGKNWFLDISYGRGSNLVDMSVENSNNASLGFVSPFSTYTGGYYYAHDVVSADFSKAIEFKESKLDIAFGGEYRTEEYRLLAGTEVSYQVGTDTTDRGVRKSPGFQGYRGIKQEDALEEIRTNGSAYLEVDFNWKKLKLVGAVRQEEYSDFGSRSNVKLATSYRFANQLVLRGSYSTGFKAPSLQQIYYQRTSNVLIDEDFASVGVINPNTPVVGNFLSSVGALAPEISESVNFGLTSAVNRNISFSLDFHQTTIFDRIGLSQRIPTDGDPFTRQLFQSTGLDFFQVFGNIAETQTTGFDAVLAAQFELGDGLFEFDSRFSYLETSVKEQTRDIEEVEDAGLEYQRSEQAIISTYVPNYKWRNSLSGTWNKLKVIVSHTRYGETTYLHPEDGDEMNWVLNTNSGIVETRDQVFSPKDIISANVKYGILPGSTLTLGVVNLTNQYPDPLAHSDNVLFGVNTYSQSVRPFDLRGAYFFTRFDIKF